MKTYNLIVLYEQASSRTVRDLLTEAFFLYLSDFLTEALFLDLKTTPCKKAL